VVQWLVEVCSSRGGGWGRDVAGVKGKGVGRGFPPSDYRVWGNIVSSSAGSRAEPQPKKLVDFFVIEPIWWKESSVCLLISILTQTYNF